MIVIPSKFKKLLEKNSELNGVIESTIYEFNIWFEDNKLEFFPEYSDHGVNHINQVLNASESIITDESWEHITSEDVFILILSILVHDCAMHLNSDNFIYLITNENYNEKKSKFIKKDLPWKILWDEFLAEALRWDGKKLNSMFGSNEPIKKLDINTLNSSSLDKKDRLLLGEFIRKYHTRLAHEIILNGVPTENTETIKVKFDNEKLLDIAGLVARSHGDELRKVIDLLGSNQKKFYLSCHIPFIMGVLRIADYIQIDSSRAPKQLLKIKKLISPISKDEMKKHVAIDNIHLNHDDPEALFVETEPNDVRTFLLLKALFKNIQYEMDSFWANMGEIYGRHDGLNNLGIVLRRIRSSLDDVDEFIKITEPKFVPEKFSFKTADTEMLNLLVKPLYGNKPEIGIRELLQNALDACRERYNYLLNHNKIEANIYKENAKVKISLLKIENIYKVVVEDNGIGMNKNVISNYFFNIGASFRNSDAWKKENVDDVGNSKVYRTGRFGIGVLAAFLLGEKIDVNTKFINDEKGYKFYSKIDDEFIEMNFIKFEDGTTISIDINENTYEQLKKENKEWDWFCLSWPKVERVIDGRILEQNILVSDEKEKLSNQFYKIESSEYDNIIWSYNLEKKEKLNYYHSESEKYFRGLICNGIKIQKDFNHKFELNIADSPSIKVDRPALLIFDQNGRLPINLQRDQLLSYELSFIEELKYSIAKDYVNNLKEKLLKIDYELSSNMFKTFKEVFFKKNFRYREYSAFPQISIFKNTYLPFDYTLINKIKPKTIIFEPSENGCQIGNKLMEYGLDYIIPIYNPDKTISSRVHSIRNLFYENLTSFNIDSRVLIIKKSEIKELEGKNYFPKSILSNKKEININDDWVMYKDNIFKGLDIQLTEIVDIMEKEDKYFLSIWNIKWLDNENTELSHFAKAWLEIVKSPTLEPNKK
jgi:molecular chaperone HtpG